MDTVSREKQPVLVHDMETKCVGDFLNSFNYFRVVGIPCCACLCVMLFLLVMVIVLCVQELQNRFLDHALLDVMGMIYPHYWMVGDAEKTFEKHLDIIKKNYFESKIMGVSKNSHVLLMLLDRRALD